MGTLEQIRELIPAESAALYIAGLGVIPREQLVVIMLWALLGLVFALASHLDDFGIHSSVAVDTGGIGQGVAQIDSEKVGNWPQASPPNFY